MESLKNYFRLVAEGKCHDVRAKLCVPLLAIASFFYGVGVRIFRWSYDKKLLKQTRLPFPVISVGNLTWGGTGKTPLVEFLARKISAIRRTPLILTRGYNHDEVEEFRHHMPAVIVGVGRDRVKTALKIRKEKRIDIAILDDGLQHVAVERDVEIIVVNSLNPFGNGQLLPRGILREPMPVLGRATVVVLTHVNLVTSEQLKQLRTQIQVLAPRSQLVEAYMEPLFLYRAKNRARLSIEKMQNRKTATFAAVGTPRSFQLVLQRSGIKTVRNFEFLDHHEYTETDLEEIKEISRSAGVEEIITTEKDFYRSRDLITTALNPLILAARLRIRSGEEILTDRLLRLLGIKR
ncbi:MAG: Tetraacyldisaccharide 4'-kinase [Candidatus Omnitrophica bacterium ADurb.Bin277]|nr:MAG: Tetraacyldisaccharide 4'-kinase [Candidatus Omnitrophica bacterium ADurb.Bin277]